MNDLLEQREVETVGSEPEVKVPVREPALYRAVNMISLSDFHLSTGP